MRMEQGVRTGLGHGGITCVLQTQFSSYIYLPINVCILTKLLKVSIMERLFSLRVTSVQEIVSNFPHLHYSPHHLCSENHGRLTDVDATSLSH